MGRVIGACALLLVWVPASHAQTLSVPATAVAPGASVSVTVTGTAGQNYALVGSATGSGLTFNGVPFSVGTAFQILSVGVLDGAGTAVVPVTPPFPASDRYYLQALTSASAGFIPFALGPGLPLVNTEVSKLFQALGGGVTAAGVGFAMSPGVTVTRTAQGTYRVDYAGQGTQATNFFPNVSPNGAATLVSLVGNNGTFTVQFTTDVAFYFTVTPVRR